MKDKQPNEQINEYIYKNKINKTFVLNKFNKWSEKIKKIAYK